MRKLRSGAKSAMLGVEHLQRRFLNPRNDTVRNPAAPSRERFRLREGGLDHRRLLDHIAIFFFVGLRDAEQHAAKARATVSVLRWKVSPTIKRLTIRSEKCGQRPSALPAHRLHRDLIAAVDIGTLVAIHLHGNEVFVHDRCNFGIVVGLAIHHVTPVAPHCADIEQHGLVLALRGGEGLLAPLVPANRLMHGGAQVSGGRAGEGVEGGGGHAIKSKLSL